MSNLTKRFGARCRELRLTRTQLSQEQFARKYGIERSYYATIEQGRRNVTLENIRKLAACYGVTLEEMFSGVDVKQIVLNMDILFDRDIKESHYISPCTVTVSFKDGTDTEFDFRESERWADETDGKLYHICEKDLDITEFPDAAHLAEYLEIKEITGITVCIYTGDNNDGEIHPAALKSFTVADDAGNVVYQAPENILLTAKPEETNDRGEKHD